MTQFESKDAFRARIVEGHRRLDALIEGIDHETLSASNGVEWSVKDVLAHIADWESYVVLRVEARRRGEEAPVWGLDDESVDARNAELMSVNRTLSAAEALEKYRAAHEALLAIIDSLSEEDLVDDSRREAVIGPWPSPVWSHIAANTYEHYEEHFDTIADQLGR